MHPAAWHPDPTGRHQFRYWDGSAWTEHVANDGVTRSDPLDVATDHLATTEDLRQAVAPTMESLHRELTQLRRDVAELTQRLGTNGTPPSAATFTPPGPLAGTDGRNAIATASAVIGSLAFVTAFVPVLGILGVIAGVGAIIFGTVGRQRARETGIGGGAAITGIVTGALAAVIGVLITVVLLITVNSSTFLEDFREFSACVDDTGDVDTCADQFENSELFRLFR